MTQEVFLNQFTLKHTHTQGESIRNVVTVNEIPGDCCKAETITLISRLEALPTVDLAGKSAMSEGIFDQPVLLPAPQLHKGFCNSSWHMSGLPTVELNDNSSMSEENFDQPVLLPAPPVHKVFCNSSWP